MKPHMNTTRPAILPHPTPTGDQSRATSPEDGTSSPSGAFPDQKILDLTRKVEIMTQAVRELIASRLILTEHTKGGEGAGSTERHERPVLIQRRLFLTLVEAVFWLLSGIGFWTVVDLIWEALK